MPLIQTNFTRNAPLINANANASYFRWCIFICVREPEGALGINTSDSRSIPYRYTKLGNSRVHRLAIIIAEPVGIMEEKEDINI